MSCYYDCEDYVSDVPKVDHDAESLYSEDFDWDNFACELNDNLEEANETDLDDTVLPCLKLLEMYFYPTPFPHFVYIYGFE